MARLKLRRSMGSAKTRAARAKRIARRLECGRHSRWARVGQQRLMHTKSEWGSGAWQDEPDRLEWRHASGLPCLILRSDLGALCGYVGVPPAHPLYMRDFALCELSAHGGINYSAHFRRRFFKFGLGEETDIWWFGFDCAHCNDLVPCMRAVYAILPRPFIRSEAGMTYRSIEYVRDEVERLAEQVAEASNG